MQSSGAYFVVLTGRGYFLVGVFALVFYFLCFLHAKNHICSSVGVVAMGTCWVGSLIWFLSLIQAELPLMCRSTLCRMRLHSAAARFFGVYAIFTLLAVPYL